MLPRFKYFKTLFKFQLECQLEANKSLKYNFNDLVEKHKLCLQCIEAYKIETNELKKNLEANKV